MPIRTHLLARMASVALAMASAAHAADTPSDAGDLSLEELLKTDVRTASRKTERLQDVAAAVFVITREGIERSGAMRAGQPADPGWLPQLRAAFDRLQ